MKFLKNKTFYAMLIVGVVVAAGGYYLYDTNTKATSAVTTIEDSTQPTQSLAVEEITPSSIGAVSDQVVPASFNETDANSTRDSIAPNARVSRRPLLIYVRKVDDPIVCGDEADTTGN